MRLSVPMTALRCRYEELETHAARAPLARPREGTRRTDAPRLPPKFSARNTVNNVPRPCSVHAADSSGEGKITKFGFMLLGPSLGPTLKSPNVKSDYRPNNIPTAVYWLLTVTAAVRSPWPINELQFGSDVNAPTRNHACPLGDYPMTLTAEARR